MRLIVKKIIPFQKQKIFSHVKVTELPFKIQVPETESDIHPTELNIKLPFSHSTRKNGGTVVILLDW